jgi:hypothetical protein
MALESYVRPWLLFNFLISYTVGRTPWKEDQPVARLLPAHRTTQTQNIRTQTSLPQVGFEPTIPVFERAKRVHAWEGAATVIGGITGRTSPFLTSALGGGEWLASRPFCFTLEEMTFGTHWIEGLMGLRAGLDSVKKRQIFCFCRECATNFRIKNPCVLPHSVWMCVMRFSE